MRRLPGLILGALLLLPSVRAQAVDIDIGFKFNDGTKEETAAACQANESPLQMMTQSGTVYGITLVDPTHPDATNARILLATGEVKAIKRYVPCGQPKYAGYGNWNGSYYQFYTGSGDHHDNGGERAMIYGVEPRYCITSGAKCSDFGPKNSGTTADRLCTAQGYNRVLGWNTDSYDSQNDNGIAYWNGSSWVIDSASNQGNSLLWGLRCGC